MPVDIDASGHRSVQVEAEVPGTPEEVWRAIATGPGITSWFVPSEVEERVGGSTVCHFGPGMDSVATITEWNPPHRFIAVAKDDMGPGTPDVATEWIVEARAGGQCVVRVVHRWFASTDEWDSQFEQHQYGWMEFFRILRMYLTHFGGQPCTVLQLMGVGPEPRSKAWEQFTGKLGLDGAVVGQPFRTAEGAPPLSGLVERAGEPNFQEELMLRLEQPAPGIGSMFALPMAGQIFLLVRLYLYGDQAATAVTENEPLWQEWMNAQFPTSMGDGSSSG